MRGGHKGLTLRKRRKQPRSSTTSKIRREQLLAKEQREVDGLIHHLIATRPEFFKS